MGDHTSRTRVIATHIWSFSDPVLNSRENLATDPVGSSPRISRDWFLISLVFLGGLGVWAPWSVVQVTLNTNKSSHEFYHAFSVYWKSGIKKSISLSYWIVGILNISNIPYRIVGISNIYIYIYIYFKKN